MWKSKEEFKYILDKTYSSLSEILESLQSPYQYFDSVNKKLSSQGKTNEVVTNNLTSLANAVSMIQEYKKLMGSIDNEYKTEVLDKMEAMEKQTIQMTERIKLLEAENERLKEEVKSKEETVTKLVKNYQMLVSNKNDMIKQFVDTMNTFNSRIDGAVKQIACKEYLQSDDYKARNRKGAKAPRYRQDINNADLANKYKSGTSIKALAEEYGMTENGMRLRLKELGVWKDRRYKK